MDSILVVLLCISPAVFFISVMVWLFYYSTERTFMVRDLERYGGWITYQGVEYRIQRGAEIKVGMGYIIVTMPNGDRVKFALGNAFSPQPVVRIERY